MFSTSAGTIFLLVVLSIFSVEGSFCQSQEMDEQTAKSKSGRTLVRTEAGREYQVTLKTKAYKQELQDLIRLGSHLVQHDGSSVEVLPSISEESVAKWFHTYISLGQIEQDLRHLFTQEELEGHTEMYKTKMETINQMKSILEEHQAAVKVSSGRPPSRAGASARSGSSRSVKSGLQLLRIQTEHNKAEFEAKLKMLKRKQDLDRQRQELERKQEMLELETQMVVHKMQEEVVDKFERELDDNTGQRVQREEQHILPQANLKEQNLSSQEGEQGLLSGTKSVTVAADLPNSQTCALPPVSGQVGLNVEAPSFEPASRPPSSPQEDQGQSSSTVSVLTSLSQLLVEQNKRAHLPVIEPDIFSGEEEKFHLWMNNFKTYIENRTACPQERLHFLSRYTSGEARMTIEGLLHLHTPDAYDKAKKKLQDRYGNDFITANAFRKHIHEWPSVRPGDGKALRQLTDYLESCRAASRHVTGLESLDSANENNVILKKLPRYIVDRWRRVVDNRLYEPQEGHPPSYPSFSEFVDFLSKEARVACGPVLERPDDSHSPRRATPMGQRKKENARAFLSSVSSNGRASGSQQETENVRQTERTVRSCKVCSAQHQVEGCQVFKNMSVSERHDTVTRLGLCRGCLCRGHIWKNCRNRRKCEKCGCSHPTLLHDEARARTRTASVEQVPGATRDTSSRQDKVHMDRCTQTQVTSLKVAVEGDTPLRPSCSHTMIVPVILRNEEDPSQEVIVYAVLDPQSDASFIKESTLRKVSGHGEQVILHLSTMAGKTRVVTQRVINLSVQGVNSSDRIMLPVTYSRDAIPAERWLIPKRETTRNWRHLSHLEEKLPPYFPDAEIGLLIGVNCPRAVRPKEVVSGNSDDPWAMKTELGWSIVGFTHSSNTNTTCHCARIGPDEVATCHFAFKTHAREVSPMEVVRMLEADFLNDSTDKKVSQEDQRFQNIMEEHFHQREDGHVEGPLPLRNQDVTFPDNKKMALKRLYSLKRRFAHDSGLKSNYETAMKESLAEGYTERVPEGEDAQEGRIWYVPHHAVVHPRKDKIRVVYDCSAEFEGTSLNSQLLQGPDYGNSLTGILTRFRKERVALSCDIKAMFNQVAVSKEHRNLLRFLWWDQGDMSHEPAEYRVTTHLFGAVSSPACAMYALNMIADKYEQKHGRGAADFVKRNFYVDDGVTSVEDAETATQLAQDTIKLCAEGGFKLHKFVSNEPSVIEALPPDASRHDPSVEVARQHSSQFEQALGIQWDTVRDTLNFRITVPDRPMTRRGILSSVSSLYDPLGLLSPVLLEGKNIIKQLCCDGYSWDEAVPEETVARWLDWKEDVLLLSDVSVPRCYTPGKCKVKLYELHHFSDASTLGYGQCTYLRTIDERGVISTCLVMSKVKVTPKRPITVPRLELMAAVLSVKVGCFLQEELDIPGIVQYYWTDSQVVLGYIRNETRRFHVFVANRVQQIRQHTSPDQWRYIRSEENPADLASRGLRAAAIKDCHLWWHGPGFLEEAGDLPNEAVEIEPQDDDPEVKKRVLATSSRQAERRPPDLADRLAVFSNWFKAKRAVAICVRYQELLLERVRRRHQKSDSEPVPSLTKAPIRAEELKAAELIILKSMQRQEFEDEVVSLTTLKKSTERNRVKKRSDLHRLDPFMAEDEVLRVGGRLKRSGQPFEVVHPVILPKDHHVTRLVIADCHERTQHAGRELTLSEIRMSGYWIVRGRRAVGRHIMNCIKCKKLRGTPSSQKMADLPRERMDEVEPFTYTGVDCFGPFLIKERRSEVKRWGILFTCLSSRAIHLETLNSMTADAFINAYRRFTCRRGKVRALYHDRGTNFIGGKGYLEAALSEMDHDTIRRTLLKDSCDWVQFNPITPKASHMGGAWERQIRTVRSALSSLLQDVGQQLDDELLRTLMTEAEAVVNSRPLSCISMNDASVVEPITPSQLLTLKSTVVLPPPGKFCRPDVYGRQRWRRVQYLANQFWTRWRREFLPSLQERRKWHHPEPNIERDDVVVVVEDDAPRNRWPLGRVVDAYTGADGLVRSVRVRIGDSEYDRPIHKLILLLKSGAGDSATGSRGAE